MKLLEKIQMRQATVAVVGLGYVGLPLAVAFAQAGFRVVGIDVDDSRVQRVNRAESFVQDVPSELLAEVVHSGSDRGLFATTRFEALAEADAVIICVPTPLSKTKDPDTSYIIAAADEIARYLHHELLVVLESTTYPGTTTEIILPRLQGANGCTHKVGTDFYLAFSPERIDPGRTDWTVRNTPKVIGGVTPECLRAAQALYACAIERIVPVSSTAAAEMVKLLENTFRAVNIGLVNEMAIMCGRLGIDVWEVIEAAKTKPYGFMAFFPGPGLGGHCIPIDPQYLAWKLKTLSYNARFIQLAEEVNFGMPRYVLEKIQNALNEDGKPLKGSRVLLLGVTYKADIADLRESPALDLIHMLCEKGVNVSFNDPYVSLISFDGMRIESSPLDVQTLRGADCVVIISPHSSYDWKWGAENTSLIIDTRNALHDVIGARSCIIRL